MKFDTATHWIVVIPPRYNVNLKNVLRCISDRWMAQKTPKTYSPSLAINSLRVPIVVLDLILLSITSRCRTVSRGSTRVIAIQLPYE